MAATGFSRKARSIYRIIRLSGYACGAAGGVLAYGGRWIGDADTGRLLFQFGFGLLILMFLLFSASYVFFVIMKFSRPRAEEKEDV